jgi:hypothetical protein
MAAVIFESEQVIRDSDGAAYRARILGEPRADGTWEAWIEFVPTSGDGPVLRTGRETTQPNVGAVQYWAITRGPSHGRGDKDRSPTSRAQHLPAVPGVHRSTITVEHRSLCPRHGKCWRPYEPAMGKPALVKLPPVD